MPAALKTIRIGTSGWAYKEWGKTFFPKNIPQREHLSFYAKAFSTVEINSTFYRLASIDAFKRWSAQTPPGFVFAVKLSSFISHVKQLRDSGENMRRFLNSARGLGKKAGPVLVQLPPSFRFNAERIREFLEAVRGAERTSGIRLRLAFEFRHRSWFGSDGIRAATKLLAKHNAAFVFAHSSRFPYPESEPLSADFVYVRFHGPQEFAASRYGTRRLRPWAAKMKHWERSGKDVFAYFNDDMHGYAVKDALVLKKLAGA